MSSLAFLVNRFLVLPSLLPNAMLTLLRLCLLLAAFYTLVSSECVPSHAQPAVYKNCSGNDLVPLPHGSDSTPFFKPQIRVNPLQIKNNGTGWEEWLFIHQGLLPDGSELTHGYKWALGDPTSANVSHTTFIVWAYFPNGTFYREIVHDAFQYAELEDGGFKLSIASNSLTWDPVSGLWKTSINVQGWVIETSTER